MLPGGPSIVVVNHPNNEMHVYLDMMMLPGGPRIYYSRPSIEYDYGPQAISISFGIHGRPSVTYRNGTPLVVRAKRATAEVRQNALTLVQRTGLPAVGKKISSGAGNVAATTADRVQDLGKAVVAPVAVRVKATPLSRLITSSAEDRASHLRDNAAKQPRASKTSSASQSGRCVDELSHNHPRPTWSPEA